MIFCMPWIVASIRGIVFLPSKCTDLTVLLANTVQSCKATTVLTAEPSVEVYVSLHEALCLIFLSNTVRHWTIKVYYDI